MARTKMTSRKSFSKAIAVPRKAAIFGAQITEAGKARKFKFINQNQDTPPKAPPSLQELLKMDMSLPQDQSKEQAKFFPPQPLNRKVVDLNLQKGDIVAVQRDNGTISLAVLEQAPPIAKKTNAKGKGKPTKKKGNKPKDEEMEIKMTQRELNAQLKVKIFDNVAPKQKNYYKQTQQEDKITIHSILGKAMLQKTSVDSTYFLSEEERLKILGEEAPKPTTKKRDDSKSQPPEGKAKKKKKAIVTEADSDYTGYNFYKISQSQNVMKVQAKMEKKWERANEVARRAIERQRARQLQKKQRTGRNWMKKVIPNNDITQITENPYLPLSSGYHVAMNKSTSEGTEKFSTKRDSSSSKKSKKKSVKELEAQKQNQFPKYPSDQNDILTCNREMLHAVITNNIKRVKQIIADTQHVSTIFQSYSVAQSDLNPFWISVDMRHLEIYQIFLKEIQNYQKGKIKGRVTLPPSDLQQQSTGNINPMAYNTYVRRVAVARGSKEGNNAFTHDKSIRNKQFVLSFADLLKHNPTKQMIEMYANILREGQLPNDDYSVIVEAVRQGNVELSCSLIQQASKDYNYGFVPAHTHAFTKEISNYRLPTTVVKSPGTNYGVTPIHCAAIIPDTSMLKRFFQFSNGNDVADQKGWTIAHYAAASKSSEPLSFLIKNNFPLNNPQNEQGLTPLMIAAKLGRYQNVVVLLKAYKAKQQKLKKRQEEIQNAQKQKQEELKKKEQEQKQKSAKQKKSTNKKRAAAKAPKIEKEEQLNQNQEKKDNELAQMENLQDMIIEREYHLTQDLKGLTALHHAVKAGQAQIVFYLLSQASNKELYVNMTNRQKVTPLIYASMNGYYDISKLLLSNGADAVKADRHGRHPLIHASMNGHIHICSLLLRHGVHPDLPDSSNNTAIHYACAYGWKQLIKFLIECKANPNVKNSWAVSPGLICLMKRNFSCLRFIIRQDNVDGNLLDNMNRSLASQLCMKFDFGIREQIEFLIENCQIDMKTVDQSGWTVLHHLANNDPNRIAHQKIQREEQLENNKEFAGYGNADGTITTQRYQTQTPISNYARKRMARRNRYNMYNNDSGYGRPHRYFNVQNYYKNLDEIEDQKTRDQQTKRIAKFKKTRKQVQEEMIQCAKLFVEHGIFPDEEQKTQNTLIYLALQNNCKYFVVWLIQRGATLKFPETNQNASQNLGMGFVHNRGLFGATTIQPQQQPQQDKKQKPKNNLLHLLSSKLSYQSQSMIYRALLARKQIEDLKIFARQRCYPGVTPLQSYYMNLYNLINSNQNSKRVSNMIKRIRNITQLYIQEFEINLLGTIKPFNPQVKQNNAANNNNNNVAQPSGLFGGGLGGFGGGFGGGAGLFGGGGGLFNNNNFNNNFNNPNSQRLPYNQNQLGLFEVNDIQNVQGTATAQDDQEFSDISSQSQPDNEEEENARATFGVTKIKRAAVKRTAKKSNNRYNNNYNSGGMYYGGGYGGNNNDLFQMDNQLQKYKCTECNLLHILLYPIVPVQFQEKYIGLINFLLFDLNLEGPQKFQTKNYSGLTPFAMLRKHFDQSLFEILLRAKHSTHFVQDGTKFQMIHYVVFKRSKKLVAKLIQHQPESINAQDSLGNTPLHYACQYRHSSLVAFLIQQGADLSIANKSERTPLHIAIHAISQGHGTDRDLKIEEYLTTNQEGQKLINSQDKLQRTPFHYLFVKLMNQDNNSTFDPIDVTSTILRNCSPVIDVNIQDNKGNTVLHYACRRGATISVLSILKQKAEIQAKNQVGNTAFAVALLAQKIDLGAFLINQGCQPNTLIWRMERRVEVAKKQSLPLFLASHQSTTLSKNDSQHYNNLRSSLGKKAVAPTQGSLFGNRNYGRQKKRRQYQVYQEDQDEDQNNQSSDQNKFKAETTLYYAIQNNMQGLVYMLSRQAFSKFQILAQSLKAESLNLFKRMINNSTKKQIQEQQQSGRNLYSMLAWNKNSSQWQNFSQQAHRLLRRNGLSPFEPDKKNRTALYYACKRLKHKLVSKLLKMAGDGGPKLLNAKESKNGLNSITTIIKYIKHSLVTKKPKNFKGFQNKDIDDDDDDDDDEDDDPYNNRVGMFGFQAYQNQTQNTSLQFDCSSQIMLLKKITKKYEGIMHEIDLQFEEGGQESSDFIVNFSRLYKKIDIKLADYCYYYQYLFDKIMNPQFWVERVGLKPRYQSNATVFAAKMNNFSLLHFLLNNCKLPADTVDSNSRSALTWGVLHNNTFIAELVLQKLDNGNMKETLDRQFHLISLPENESGKTSLHWALKSIQPGSFANQKIIQRFVDIAKKTNNFDKLFNLQDSEGFTPISLARKNIYLFGLIKQFSGKDIGEPQMFQPRKLDPKFIESPLGDKKFDVSKDANQYIQIKEEERRLQKKKQTQKLREIYMKQAEEKGQQFNQQDFLDEINENKVEVNRFVIQNQNGNFKVIRDQEINQYFDVFGTKIDVNKYCNGQAVFYEMQILYEKNKQYYLLFTRWGRLGDTYGGQFQKTPFPTLLQAKAEFIKVFKQKFALAWESQQYFPMPSKYRIKIIGGRRIVNGKPEEDQAKQVRYSRRQFSINSMIASFEKQKTERPKFQSELVQFISPITSAYLLNRGFNMYQIHDEFFLLTLLDPTILDQAKQILNQIEKQVKKLQKAMKNTQVFTTQGILQQIIQLSNQYYDLVPPLDSAYSALQPIRSQNDVKHQRNKLASVYDISITTKLMFGASLLKHQINPYDYLLHNLNVKLQPLQSDDSQLYDTILLYINNGLSKQNQSISVVNIFEVDLEGSKKRQYESQEQQLKSQEIFNKTHNHFLLWHGTAPQNMINILERGLMISGHNSVRAGSLFGEGIYFADSIGKSINYAPFQNNTNYILLCQVALGNVLNTDNVHQYKEPPFGYHSVRFAGSTGPDFNYSVVNDEGITLPLGPIIQYPKKVCLHDGKLFRDAEAFNYYIKHGKPMPKSTQLNVFEPVRNQQEQQENEEDEQEADIQNEDQQEDDEYQNQKQEEEEEDEEEEEEEVVAIKRIAPISKSSTKKASQKKKTSSKKKSPPKKKTAQEIRKEFLNPSQRVKRFKLNVIPHLNNQYFNFYGYGTNQTEYVVYNSSQVKVKYIVQLRQNVNQFGY